MARKLVRKFIVHNHLVRASAGTLHVHGLPILMAVGGGEGGRMGGG